MTAGRIFFLLFYFDDKRIDPSEKIWVRFCFLIKECNLKVNIAAWVFCPRIECYSIVLYLWQWQICLLCVIHVWMEVWVWLHWYVKFLKGLLSCCIFSIISSKITLCEETLNWIIITSVLLSQVPFDWMETRACLVVFVVLLCHCAIYKTFFNQRNKHIAGVYREEDFLLLERSGAPRSFS